MRLKIKTCIGKVALIFLSLCIISTALTTIKSYANQYREQTDINNIDEGRYPGYKARLLEMKSQHPNWNFIIFYTGLDWDTVVYNETTAYHGRSLIQNKSGEWLCSVCGDRVYDGSNWYCASTKALSYYLDPRNFLDSTNVYQFEALSYVEGAYTEAGIESILSGTFMCNQSIRGYYNNENYTEVNFSTIIMEAGRESGVSPYHIASRIKQEIIVSGGGPSGSASGNVVGYEGYYNFFNIGATSGEGAVERGLKYAQTKGWDSPEKSIKEGAKTISSNYIGRGQNTLYLEKFDVDSSDNTLYSHQYQQNIKAPTNEGKRIYSAYANLGMIDHTYNFIIPVYENMPESNSAMPQEGFSVVTENVELNTDGIMLRTEDNTWAPAICYVNRGDKLLRIERGGAYKDGFIWDKVVNSDGQKGYIETKFLNKIDDIITANDAVYVKENVNLRNGPGLNGTTVITKLYSGTQLTRIEAGKYVLDGYTWDRVRLADGSQGYLARNFLGESSSELSGEVVKVIANGSLKLREQPTTDSAVITSLATGTLLTRLEKNVATANDLVWDKVQTVSGKIGYVASKYLEGVQEDKPLEPDPAPTPSNNFWTDDYNKIINCSPAVNLENLKNGFSGKNIVGKDKNGAEIADNTVLVGTGMIISIDNIDYQVVKYGDVNGDGTIDARDSLRILKYVVGEYNLDEKVYFYAADVSFDNVVDARDSLRILKYTVGEYEIRA